MEKLKVRFKRLNQALQTFGKVIGKFNNITPNHEYYEEVRDSVIQRFEYSIDIFWKALKDYLEVVQGLDASGSPKAVLRLCLDVKLITEEECELFIDMVEDRNATSHAYNVDIAEEISRQANSYYQFMKSVSERIYRKLSH